MSSDPETVVTTCRCGHDSELHSLEKVEFKNLPAEKGGNLMLAYLFSCRGLTILETGAPVLCGCNNLRPLG